MKHKRLKAFCMALLLVALAAADLQVFAAGETVEKVTLSFVKGDEGDPTRATIITGNSIGFKQLLPTGFVPADNKRFEVKKSNGDPAPTGIDIPSPYQTIEVSESFIPTNTTDETYYISGNYYALLAEGSALEQNPYVDTISPIKATTEQAVTEFSTCTLECTDAETTGMPPKFKVLAGGSAGIPVPSGIFKGMENSVVPVENRSGKGGPLKISIVSKATGHPYTFEMTPKASYNYYTLDIDTEKDTGAPNYNVDASGRPLPPLQPGDPIRDKKVLKTPADSLVRKGTTFQLIFPMPVSNQLFLTVMTPLHAIGLINNDIKLSDGESNQKYIKLASGDALNYITKPFELRGKLLQYNATFAITWRWDATKYDGVDIPTADKYKYKDVVKIGTGTSEMSAVGVSPMEDNVEGTLSATVTYKKPDGGEVVSTTPVSKTVLIRGTGKPVSAMQTSETMGSAADKGTPTPYDADHRELPARKQMDAYKGGVTGFVPKGAHTYQLTLDMGAKNGAAKYATVAATGDTSALAFEVKLPGEQLPTPYTPGQRITNDTPSIGSEGNKVELYIYAQPLPTGKTNATVNLDMRFFVEGRGGVTTESVVKPKITINVLDSTPSQNSALSGIIFKDQKNKEFPFTAFKSDVLTYKERNGAAFRLPYQSDQVSIKPVLADASGAKTPIKIEIHDSNGALLGSSIEVSNNAWSAKLPADALAKMTPGLVYTLYVTAYAQDPTAGMQTTYEIDIMRSTPSDNANLKSLKVFYEDDATAQKNDLIKGFSPTKVDYEIEIPYSTKQLYVRAEKDFEYAEISAYSPELQKKIGAIFGDADWLNIVDAFDPANDGQPGYEFDSTGRLVFKVSVQSERQIVDPPIPPTLPAVNDYKVYVRRLPPNDVSTLSALAVKDGADVDLKYTPAWKPSTEKRVNETYTIQTGYSTKEIKLSVTPTDKNVSDIIVTDELSGKVVAQLSDGSLKQGVFTKTIPVKSIFDDPAAQALGHHPFKITVIAEDGAVPGASIYDLRIERAEPNTEARLDKLVLTDQLGTVVKKDYAFHKDEFDYTIHLPYESEQIDFTPTVVDPNARIRIDDPDAIVPPNINPYYVPSGSTSKRFKLADAGASKIFKIQVYSEGCEPPGITNPNPSNEHFKTYTLTLIRDLPSDDAQLKGLTAAGIVEPKIKPTFISSTLKYTATVAEGVAGVTITATANHPGAVIRINGEVVESGKPSGLIELLAIDQTIDIVVTAQDQRTTKTYQITFHNENLIDKSSNADLEKLTVNYGQMTPSFKSAVVNYEIAVTEDTYSVDIIPRAADPLAKVEVLSGTREISDYDGNYAQALEDGENELTVRVTAPDESIIKNYALTIYRNEEDELKNLTPLQPEDIDFELSDDVIIVSINQYPRVSAEVFNKLKEYPEKTMIFQGNDYSLTFKAADLKRVIPQTEIYDFRMSFTSPEEEKIYDLVERRDANDDIVNRMVLVYFPYHGDLPAPAILNLSLGRKYASDTLYWHYYNMERDRIDYYGTMESNTKGTFAVYIDHFSTYPLTLRHRISGSEDKQGNIDMTAEDLLGGENLSPASKVNPNTGERGAAE